MAPQRSLAITLAFLLKKIPLQTKKAQLRRALTAETANNTTQNTAAILSYNEYTDNQVMTMMNYLIQEGNAKQFITEIAKQSEKHEGVLMTMAEALRQEGRQEGLQQGLQKGKQEGYQEATRKLAKQLLDDGVGRDHVKRYTGLSDEQLDTLTQ